MTKKHYEIINFVKTMISVDLSLISEGIRLGAVSVDVSNLDKQTIRQVESVGLKYNRFRIEPNGYKAIALIPLQ